MTFYERRSHMAIPSAKRIVSCAITGSIHTPSMSPYLPITPDEISQNAIDAANAGAACIHIHARDPKNGMPSPDLELYREIIDKIRCRNKEVIICITTGGGIGMTVEQRAAVIPEFKPELASMNAGSINWGLFPAMSKINSFKFPWEPKMLSMTKNFIFENTFSSMEQICKIMDENGTKPELEVYDMGHLSNIAYLLAEGIIKQPVYLQFVTGILGGINSTPYDIMNLHYSADRILGRGNYQWSVVGAGKAEYTAATLALLLGGNVRVGMEDSLFLEKGKLARNNAEMVEKMVRIMKELDLEPATPRDAREILALSQEN
jgi:uncharacterized protein (DUF849 family)